MPNELKGVPVTYLSFMGAAKYNRNNRTMLRYILLLRINRFILIAPLCLITNIGYISRRLPTYLPPISVGIIYIRYHIIPPRQIQHFRYHFCIDMPVRTRPRIINKPKWLANNRRYIHGRAIVTAFFLWLMTWRTYSVLMSFFFGFGILKVECNHA